MNNILYVDTSKFFSSILNETGKLHGFKCVSTNNPKEAFKILDNFNEQFDLIITALEFSNETGLDFINRLKLSKYKDIPILVVSGHSDRKDEILRAGAYDFISKKISITTLIHLIIRIEKETYLKKFFSNKKIAIYSNDELYISNWKNALLNHKYDIKNIDFYNTYNELLKNLSKYTLFIFDFNKNSNISDEITLKIRQTEKDSIIFGLFNENDINVISDFLISGGNDFLIKSKDTNNFNANISLFVGKLYSNVRTYNLLKEIEVKNKELEYLAIRDSLTKLYNHNYMYNKLENMIAKSKEVNNSLCVLMVDIDDFKIINDTYGHPFGDKVLISVSKCLTDNTRDTDIIGRYGGEEFMIIFPNTNLYEAKEIAERLRLKISEIKFNNLENLKITISGGLSEVKNENAINIVKKADKLLYEAKKNGKNKIVI